MQGPDYSNVKLGAVVLDNGVRAERHGHLPGKQCLQVQSRRLQLPHSHASCINILGPVNLENH